MNIELASTISGAPASRWKRYPAYTDSGVEWLGEVPDGWMIKRVGIDTKSLTGFAFESEQFSYDDEHIKLVRGDNVTTGKLRWGDKTRRWSEISHDLERYLLEENDIVIGMDGSKVGKNYAIVKEGDLPLILVQRVARIRCLHSLIPRFLYYFIANDLFSYYVNLTKTDPAVPHITLKNIRDYPICFPSLSEQRAIAAFLDRETECIDTLIEKKERQIELLQEKRTVLISHAVTKGLDPDVKMKDSGVKLLGEVPEHWELKKLKYLVLGFLKYGANESAELEDTNLPRYIRITDFGDDGKLKQDTFKSLPHEIAKDYLLENGDILFARSGATVGKTFQFKNHEKSACFAGYLIKASPDEKKVLSDYLYLFTKSNSYEMWKNSIFIKATIQNIGADKYNSLTLSVPPLPEQRAIAAFLDRETGRIDILTTKIHESISKLREYRTALISAAVTGKIDVREGV